MSLVSDKLRNSAKGQPCMLKTPFCNHNAETSILCHAPSHLKGMGNKSPDFFAAFGCDSCHWAMDLHQLTEAEKLVIWHRAVLDTITHWIDCGLIVVKKLAIIEAITEWKECVADISLRREILDKLMGWVNEGLIIVAGHQTRATGSAPKKHRGRMAKKTNYQWPSREIPSRGFQTRGK